MKTFLLLILLLPTLSFAYFPTKQNSCTALDLRNDSLGPVRNQGEISWCYAFTAADMLSHAFKKNEHISASDVAINYNQSLVGRIMSVLDPNGNPHERGFNKIALETSMRNGFCPEDVFPSETWIKVIDGKEQEILMPAAMKEIEKLHLIKDQLNSKNLPFYFKFKNITKVEFLSLLKANKLKNFFNELRIKACQLDRESSPARWKVKMVFRNPSIFSRASEQLEQGRLVGLDYDSRILASRNHRGVKLSELHTSSMVGRRWNEERNTCEFLIRDSYGPQCSRYDESYDCEEGNIWLGEAEIYSSLVSVVYMLSTP